MSQFITITASDHNGDFHPDCAIEWADDAGLPIPGTGQAMQRITAFLGSESLPGNTVVTITTAPDWTVSSRTCDGCNGSLAAAPAPDFGDPDEIEDFTLQDEPEEALDLETIERAPTGVRYDGRTYTLAQALAYAERRGLHKPEDWTWEQAAAYAREQYGYDGLTLIYDDEDADTLAVDAQIAAEEEPLVRAVQALGQVAKALQDLITR